MTATSLFSLFSLLTIASGAYFLSLRLKIPYTVFLVAVGILLVPLSHVPLLSFLNDFTLTPELLFYIFLPILIFESAYNINVKRLTENAVPVAMLSIFSLLISAFFIGGMLWFILGLIGFNIPFTLALLFGALISATDPVAVLALFKEFGAPRRLSLIFEGESLFNDATAFALFLIILEIIAVGFHGATSVIQALSVFLTMMAGGVVIGVFMGWVFSKFIIWGKGNETVSITLMIAVAHLTFILSELISEHLIIGGIEIKISAIVATVIASMILGNYARFSISPHAEKFIDDFWTQFAFLANSIVFLLIGLLFASLPLTASFFFFPIIIAVIIVAVGRALSTYPVIWLLNLLKMGEAIPRAWQHLLAWGSLRGALSITMVLLIPDDLAFAGWQYIFTPKEFILGLTVGCIYATLFLKATTIGPIIRKLKIDALTEIEKLERVGSLFRIHTTALTKAKDFFTKEYISKESYEAIRALHTDSVTKVSGELTQMTSENGGALAERVARVYAVGIEKHFLRELFAYGEVTPRVYKRILLKLESQLELIERGALHYNALQDPNMKKMGIEFAHAMPLFRFLHSKNTETKEKYIYYRAQMIISRKVVKELSDLRNSEFTDGFNPSALEEAVQLYSTYAENSRKKMRAVANENATLCELLNEEFAEHALYKIELNTLEDLREREMLTPKLFLSLKEELRKEMRAHHR